MSLGPVRLFRHMPETAPPRRSELAILQRGRFSDWRPLVLLFDATLVRGISDASAGRGAGSLTFFLARKKLPNVRGIPSTGARHAPGLARLHTPFFVSLLDIVQGSA